MRHFQERRDKRTGSGLLWADPQLPVLKSTLGWIACFAPDSIEDWFISSSPFGFLHPRERERKRKGDAFTSLPVGFLDAEPFLRMQGEICGDTWSTGFSAHIDPGAPGESGREKADNSVNARPALLILFVCVRFVCGVVAQPKPWSTAPAARGLFWTAFCSTCWTEPGTSSACSAASANVIWQRNVFLERADCTAKMISLGKLGSFMRWLFYILISSFFLY